MKNISILLTVAAISLSSIYAESYTLDKKKSSVEWYATKVTGKHNGTIDIKSASFKGSKGSYEAEVLMSMNSITVLDVKDPKYNAKLTRHLKSDDFFGADKYPVSRLIITSTKKKAGSNYQVSGKLTIRDKTQDISFPARIDFDSTGFKAEGTLTIDRSKYDVKYGSGSFFKGLGDKLIHDEFKIKFKINAVR